MSLKRSIVTGLSAIGRVRNRLLAAAAGCLGDRGALHLFQSLGARFRVDEVTSGGECGRIQGHLRDAFIFNEYLRTGNWSPAYSDFLKLCFERAGGGTYLDLGANIGLTTVPLARLGNVRCFCFEPEPRNVKLLERNLAENCPEGSCRVFPIALYSSDSSVPFELAEENRGDHRIRSAGRAGTEAAAAELYGESARKVISVPAKRLDDVLPPAPQGEFVAIKCDTQGAELHVYQGGAGTFARADVLLTEFWPYGLQRMGSAPEQFVELLSRDFQHGILVSGRQKIESSRLENISVVSEKLKRIARDTSESNSQTDVLLIKDSVRSLFSEFEKKSVWDAPSAGS